MSASLIFCICLAYFVVAYFTYGRFLGHFFALSSDKPTPAHSMIDGIDYVPTRAPVLFGHHFASIAGPGPIVGPIMAAYFGWLPALIWILVGCVFIGAFHDFASLVISVRNKGRSVSFVMEKLMGLSGRQLFLSFCILCLILVVAIFTLLIAGLFAKFPEVATASVFFIMLSPLFAVCTNVLNMRLRTASIIFIPLLCLAIYLGEKFPLDVGAMFNLDETSLKNFWICFLAIYIFIASVTPVQWLLQPRDYMNSFLLYAVLLLGIAAIVAYSPEVKMTSFEGLSAVTGDGKITYMVPALFIFIACGACSGFHALVASGTTSKQLNRETDALPIGYGAMLIEGVLGCMALVAVMSMDKEVFMDLGKNPPAAFATGISSFCSALGLDVQLAKIFIYLAISAFMLTSLDTATRLGRFICQELCLPKTKNDQVYKEDAHNEMLKLQLVRRFIGNKYVASFILVAVSMYMAVSGEAASLWPIFGASNQLMSALTLLVISLWLLVKGVNYLLAFIPMCFMMVMSLWGVKQVIVQQWSSNSMLVGLGIILIAMSIIMVCLGLSMIIQQYKLHAQQAQNG